MVRLNKKKKEKNVVLMKDLKDGQIAVIIDKRYPQYSGRIVQRYKNYGVSIGEKAGSGWSCVEGVTLEVRVLKDSERLTIFNNQ
jgi:hypothetical protein